MKPENIGKDVFIEVEVATMPELRDALKCKVSCILLEVKKLSLEGVIEAVGIVRSSPYYRQTGKPSLEASGEVTLDNVGIIAQTEVERISVGALTHSVRALDINMKTQKIPDGPALDYRRDGSEVKAKLSPDRSAAAADSAQSRLPNRSPLLA